MYMYTYAKRDNKIIFQVYSGSKEKYRHNICFDLP